MKPVYQSKLYQDDAPMRGNCLAACLASLLEIPLWMIPAFEDMRGDLQTERRDEWLDRLFHVELIRTEGHQAVAPMYIACGPSPRAAAIHHAVIYSRAALVHDPHPSGLGVDAVEFTYHLHASSEPIKDHGEQ